MRHTELFDVILRNMSDKRYMYISLSRKVLPVFVNTPFQDKMRLGSVDWVVGEATQALVLGILNILTLTFDSIGYLGNRFLFYCLLAKGIQCAKLV